MCALMSPCPKTRSVKTSTFEGFVLPDVTVTRHSKMGYTVVLALLLVGKRDGALTKMYPGLDPGLMVRAIIQAAPRRCGELA
jgi:hypothetical protein